MGIVISSVALECIFVSGLWWMVTLARYFPFTVLLYFHNNLESSSLPSLFTCEKWNSERFPNKIKKSSTWTLYSNPQSSHYSQLPGDQALPDSHQTSWDAELPAWISVFCQFPKDWCLTYSSPWVCDDQPFRYNIMVTQEGSFKPFSHLRSLVQISGSQILVCMGIWRTYLKHRFLGPTPRKFLIQLILDQAWGFGFPIHSEVMLMLSI